MSINVLLGATASVAAIKIPELLKKLQEQLHLVFPHKECNIRLVPTEHSLHFFDPASVTVPILRDQDEWKQWSKIGDPVLHIELRKWADVMLIAPLDANTLSKLASGACDNLVTCVARAWDFTKPIIVCPAMNTFMWQHPVTNKHISEITSWNYSIVPCVEKRLACGDVGLGGLATVDTIVAVVIDSLKSSQKQES